MKRLFDICFSAAGLVLLSPLFLFISLIIKLAGKGPVFFRQERIGRGFRPFRIYKFRTMSADSSGKGPLITVGGDQRITGIGKILRKTKMDELPQLINVFRGEMSFVGPRPEVSKYVELFRDDYKKLLTVRPGITDPASILFSDEEAVLAHSNDWEKEYICRVLPEKIRLATGYVDKHDILADIKVIVKTLIRMFKNSRP
jgi:lipopolysaccharide/colanic/teichoic acid biosynthesis glycosyltransferase